MSLCAGSQGYLKPWFKASCGDDHARIIRFKPPHRTHLLEIFLNNKTHTTNNDCKLKIADKNWRKTKKTSEILDETIPKTLSPKHGSVRKIALNTRKLILKSIPPPFFYWSMIVGIPKIQWKNISPTFRFFRVKLQSHNHLPPPRVSSLQSSWKAQHSFEDFPGICPGLGFCQKHVF